MACDLTYGLSTGELFFWLIVVSAFSWASFGAIAGLACGDKFAENTVKTASDIEEILSVSLHEART